MKMFENLSPEEFVKNLAESFKNEERFPIKFEEFCDFSKNHMKNLKGETRTLYFQHIVYKVPEFFEVLINSNNSDDENVVEDKYKLLCACQFLEILQLCVENVKNDSFQSMHTVTTTVLTVLNICYSHCKDSESIYGDNLQDFSEELGNLFKQMQSAQMVLTTFLEEMSVTDPTNEEKQALSLICCKLSTLCEIVTSLDIKISAILWKTYLKLLTSYNIFLTDMFYIENSVSYLCSSAVELLKNLKIQLSVTDKENERNEKIKIASFCLKIILKIGKTFMNSFKNSHQSLLQLFIIMHDLLISSFSSEIPKSSNVECIKRFLLTLIEPFTLCFLKNTLFITTLDIPTMDSVSPEHLVSLCVFNLKFMRHLPLHSEPVCNGEKWLVLFEQILLIFSSLDNSIFSIMVPIAEHEEDFRLLTLFNYVEIQCCRNIIKICDCHFNKLELILLDKLNAESNVVSFLISRLWCHLLKRCSSALCYSHCTALLELCLRIQDRIWPKFLLSQLFNVLPLNEKNKIINEYYYDFKTIYPECSLFNTEENKPPILESTDPVPFELHSNNPSIIIKRINSLERSIISSGKENFKDNLPVLTVIACCLLRLQTMLVEKSQGGKLLKILDFVDEFWKSEVYDIQMTAVDFLKSFHSKQIESCNEQEEIFSKLSALFAEALSSDDRYLQVKALEAYHKVALTTPHPKLLKYVIRAAPHLLEEVKFYLMSISAKANLQVRNYLQLTNMGENSDNFINVLKSNEEVKNVAEPGILSMENMFQILNRKPTNVNYGDKAEVLAKLMPQKTKIM